MVEREAERAAQAIGREAKRQARNVDPVGETARAEFVAGERKVCSEHPAPTGKQTAACLEALIRRLVKTAVGERKGETSGVPGCGAQSGACPR